MERNNLKLILYFILLLVVVACNIVLKVDDSFDSPTETALTIMTILIEILSLGYFIIQDLFNTYRTIQRYGSLKLFNVIDRESLYNKVINELTNAPEKHVIYVNCVGLNKLDVENIKQKLYEGLTDYRKNNSFTKNKRIKGNSWNRLVACCKKSSSTKNELKIGNIYVPATLETEYFNETVFHNTTFDHKKTIYIFDMNSANYYFIKMIEKALNNHPPKNNKFYQHNTYIVYLTDFSNEAGIDTNLSEEDINDILCMEEKETLHSINDIKNVFTIEALSENKLYRELLIKDRNIITILYKLKIGQYMDALKILIEQRFNISQKRYFFLLADCLHLLNLYEQAYIILNYAQITHSDDPLLNQKATLLRSHILKHMGRFNKEDCLITQKDDSSRLLSNQDNRDKIAVNMYFSNLLSKLKGRKEKYLLETILQGIKNGIDFSAQKVEESIKNKMYYAALTAHKRPDQSLKSLNETIEYYEKTDNRLRFNAYYIKAEILRIANRFEEASSYYIKSSGILDGHFDLNLLDQNYFSLRALERLGLINENSSYQIKKYKQSSIKELIDKLNPTLKLLSTNKSLSLPTSIDTEIKQDSILKPLCFNNALLDYINSEALDKTELRNLLLDTVFIIL